MTSTPAPARTPRVSVIMPAYNTAAYIADALASVLAQTFDDFEAFVVDDGSDDDTVAVAERFTALDPRVRVIRQPHLGVSAARNRAMASARGALFALLDSDDMWRPDYLSQQLRIIDDAELTPDVVSANAVNYGGPRDGTLWKQSSDDVYPVSLLRLIAVEDSVCVMSVFRREVYERIGGFDVALRGAEDYDYWLRAAIDGFRIVFNPLPLGYYRRRPDSGSADEGAMLESIQEPLARVRQRLPADSSEAAAASAQLKRFKREQLRHQAKRALAARDFASARNHFSALSAQTNTGAYRWLARLARQAPALLTWAYACKRALARPR